MAVPAVVWPVAPSGEQSAPGRTMRTVGVGVASWLPLVACVGAPHPARTAAAARVRSGRTAGSVAKPPQRSLTVSSPPARTVAARP